jgi:uncharacterized protein (DUF433 family)
MALPQPQAFPHIVRVPGVVGGEPVIRGTRISVRSIVMYLRIYGDVNRIHQALPHVSVSLIREALEFYDANRAEIDHYIALDEAEDRLHE